MSYSVGFLNMKRTVNCMNLTLNMQTFYFVCRQYIYASSELYEQVLERMSQSEIHEEKGEPIIVRSWINTIDNADSSLLLTDTYNVLNRLAALSDPTLYLIALTEITVVLNNIFYSDYKSNKNFWRSNAGDLYCYLVCNNAASTSEIRESATNPIDVNDYYHRFFAIFQDKCSRLGISIKLEEYIL